MMDDPSVQFTVVEGVRLAYRASGDPTKPPMVLLHGIAETSAYFWRDLIAHFERDYHILAFDLLGHGDSARPFRGYSAVRQARLFAGALDNLNLSPAVMVGHSLGGIIAARLCVEYPDHVSDLILYDAHLPRGLFVNLRTMLANVPILALLPVGSMLLPGAGLVSNIVPFRWAMRIQLTMWRVPLQRENLTPEFLDNYVRHSRVGLAESLRKTFLLEDVVRDLHRIKARTLVVVGDTDVVLPVAIAEDISRRIEGAQLVVIPDAGHVALFDQPEAFCAALEAFLPVTVSYDR
jgi:pimeloyl-ACP methyl ester carboxylesterase